MSTGHGYGDQGYFINKSNDIVLSKSSMETVENIAMKFKGILENWREEKCPEGFSKKILTVQSAHYRLKWNESIQMLRELKSLMNNPKNVQITKEETNNLTVFVLQYSIPLEYRYLDS